MRAAVGLFFASFFIPSIFIPSIVSAAAYVPPSGFTRVGDTFSAGTFAVAPDGRVAVGTSNFAGGATIDVYGSAAAAHAASSPIAIFTDPSYHAFGDLTFTDNDTLLFSENANDNTVYRASVSSGAASALAPVGSVPNAAGVVLHDGIVYAAAANNPGDGAVYAITGGSASAVISNIGAGYLGGIAFDSTGDLLLTDSNDPTFAGNAGKLLRYSSALAPLSSIDLADGNGSGAYDLALDDAGDAFITTGATITEIPDGTTSAEQFGSAFTGFPFLTGLDYVGTGFAPYAGSGQLWVNAGFSDDGAVIGITPVPEPALAAIFIPLIALLGLRRRRRAVTFVASLVVFASASMTFSRLASADEFFATQVISTSPGTDQQSGFTDPTLALGGPQGGGINAASTDTYNLGNGGSITLGFDTTTQPRAIVNGPGDDFIVSENPFYAGGNVDASFAELMRVEVSSDGVSFARFPAISTTPGPVGALGTINPANVSGFAGVNPVLANVLTNAIDPFDPSVAGGDAFDLSALSSLPAVTSGLVNLNDIREIRLVDVIGDGTSFDDATPADPIYDPTGVGVGGADVDAVAVIHGTTLPEPAALAPLAGLLLLLRRRTNPNLPQRSQKLKSEQNSYGNSTFQDFSPSIVFSMPSVSSVVKGL